MHAHRLKETTGSNHRGKILRVHGDCHSTIGEEMLMVVVRIGNSKLLEVMPCRAHKHRQTGWQKLPPPWSTSDGPVLHPVWIMQI